MPSDDPRAGKRLRRPGLLPATGLVEEVKEAKAKGLEELTRGSSSREQGWNRWDSAGSLPPSVHKLGFTMSRLGITSKLEGFQPYRVVHPTADGARQRPVLFF